MFSRILRSENPKLSRNINLTVDMLTARALWMKTVAITLTMPAMKEERVRGKKTQETAAILSREL